MTDIERRITHFKPEIRMAGDSRHIVGHAAVFGKLSRKLGGFVEKVDSRAFNESAAAGWKDVVCRFNHNDDFLLGTIQGGTLQLQTDSEGLFYDVVPPTFRKDIIELMERGDVTSSSFAFRTIDDDWGLSDFNYPLRTLLTADLVDVAPVTTPAYPDATSAVRSTNGAIDSLARKFSADPVEIRNLLDAGNGAKLFKLTARYNSLAAKQREYELQLKAHGIGA
jgi:HK97 family phage prohead protease